MAPRDPLFPIAGAGGGGDQHVPVEDPNSLRSTQYARILDAVCEGEVEGLQGGLQGVYLNDVPLQNADSSMNFLGVQLWTCNGTPTQASIPGFPASESEQAAGQVVGSSAPVTHRIGNSSATSARVTLGFPALFVQDTSSGDTRGTSVSIAIDLQVNNGGFQQVVTDTITGKCTNLYERAYRIALTGAGPWDIRVRKLTADSTKSSLGNQVLWVSWTEIVDYKLSYPLTALVGTQFDARYFNSIPRRAYRMRLLRIKVPTNYDPIARTYTGNWNGTFKIAWSNNPAWCFYDLATSTRYGLGEFLGTGQLDKWTLYSIAQYCDGLVDDGNGGTEPRFTCNIYLQTRDQAFGVLNTLASVFRGILYWRAGVLEAVADMPTDPKYIFNQANVIDGTFTYAGTSKSVRHTVALVAWNDPADMYRQKVEYVEDVDGIARYGVIETQIVAAGCTSRGQAHRFGKWLLYSDWRETETVVFQSGLEGVQVAPGDIMSIHDPARAGVRFGGRVASATTTQVTLDQQVTLEGGKTYTLSCLMPDGTLQSKTVSSAFGSITMLTVSPAFSQAPQSESVWILAANDLVPTRWRVLAVEEKEPHVYAITGVQSDAGKYLTVEQGIAVQNPPTSYIPPAGPPLAPTAFVFSESIVNTPLGLERRLRVAWNASATKRELVRGYQVQWRFASGLWYTSTPFPETLYEIPATPGLYDIQVSTLGTNGLLSQPLIGSYVVQNTSPIAGARVTGLELDGQDNDTNFTGVDASLSWRYNSGVGSYDLGSEPYGASSGYQDVIFKDFEVRVYDASTSALRRTEFTADPHWIYTYQKNQNDGLARSFTVGVALRDKFNRLSDEARLTVANPLPAPPTGITTAVGPALLNVSYTPAIEPDYVGVVIYGSSVSGFTPSAGNIVYRGLSTTATIAGLPSAVPFYLRLASEDAFGIGNPSATEYSGTPAASAFTGADLITSINQRLTGLSDSDKIIFTTAGFAIADPNNATLFPFGIVDLTGNGDWAATIQADVVINGSLSVANLKTGELPANTQISVGGGRVVIDGGGSITCSVDGSGASDFVLLNAGQIVFKRYRGGQFYDYNTLTRSETGTANNGDTVTIPGYWDAPPKVQLSPNLMQVYNHGLANADQSLRLQVSNLQQTAPGSFQYQFTVLATLEAAAAAGQTQIQQGSGDTAAANYTSSTFTTPANAVSIVAHVKVRSKRGSGASGLWVRRQYRWRVDTKLHTAPTFTNGTITAWVDCGDFVDQDIPASMSVSLGAANTYDWRVYIEWQDKDGTTFGTPTYNTASDNITQVAGPVNSSIQDGNPWTGPDPNTNASGNITLGAYTPPAGWTIYRIDWTYQWAYEFKEGTGTTPYSSQKYTQILLGSGALLSQAVASQGQTYPSGIAGNIGNYIQVSGQQQATSTYSNTIHTLSSISKGPFGNLMYAKGSVRNVSAVIQRQQPIANNALANNLFVDYNDYTLSGSQQLATGSCNWTATGR